MANRMRSREAFRTNQEIRNSQKKDMDNSRGAMGPAAEKLRGLQWKKRIRPERERCSTCCAPIHLSGRFRSRSGAAGGGGAVADRARGSGEPVAILELDPKRISTRAGRQSGFLREQRKEGDHEAAAEARTARAETARAGRAAEEESAELHSSAAAGDAAPRKLSSCSGRWNNSLATVFSSNRASSQGQQQQGQQGNKANKATGTAARSAAGQGGQSGQQSQAQQQMQAMRNRMDNSSPAWHSNSDQAIERLKQATKDMQNAAASPIGRLGRRAKPKRAARQSVSRGPRPDSPGMPQRVRVESS